MRIIALIIFTFFLFGCTVGKPGIKVGNGRISVVCPLSQISFQNAVKVAKSHGWQWYKFNAKSMRKIVSYHNSLPDKATVDPDFVGPFAPESGDRAYMVLVKDSCVVDSGTISMKALTILLTSVPI